MPMAAFKCPLASRGASPRLVLLLAALLLLPLIVRGNSYLVYVVTLSMVYSIATIGLNILTGCAGQVSIGHAGFMAIGAFGSAVLGVRLGVPFWISVPAAGFLAAAIGALMGIPALRLHGHYLAIATLGFGEAVRQLIEAWEPVTGGYQGIKPIPASFFGLVLKTDIQKYYVVLFITVLMVILAVNILRTRIGRAFNALRDSELAAMAMGISLPKYKTAAFGVSAFFAGVSGALYGYVVGTVFPSDFNLSLSLTLLAGIVVGGLGSIQGSVIGAVFMTLVPLLFSRVQFLPSIITGGALILTIVFLPYGLVSLDYKYRLWREKRRQGHVAQGLARGGEVR